MESVVIMCLGIIVGRLFFPKKLKKANGIFQVVCTIVLIFSMGVLLGCIFHLSSALFPGIQST